MSSAALGVAGLLASGSVAAPDEAAMEVADSMARCSSWQAASAELELLAARSSAPDQGPWGARASVLTMNHCMLWFVLITALMRPAGAARKKLLAF